jgi:hypothetical protein
MEVLVAPLITIVLGLIIRLGNASWLIAGYNTASKEEKEKYDKKQLNKLVSNLLFSLAAVLLLIALGIKNSIIGLVILGGILFFVVLIGGLVYMNTGNRLSKKL